MTGLHVRKLHDALRNIVVKNAAWREFIPEGEFDKLMTPETIKHVFNEIVHDNLQPNREQSDPEPIRLSSPPHQREARKRSSFHFIDFKRLPDVYDNRKILALLVFIGREKYIMSFLNRGRGDMSLPLSPSQLKNIDPHLENSDFLDKQYSFLAIRFYKGIEKEFGDQWILPFIKDQPINKAKGAFGKIYEVEIHPDYYDSDMVSFWEGEKPIFARKELVIDDTTDSIIFELEKNALKILHSRHPNIVPLLGSYKYKDKYNFIFPRADCDLDMYFQYGAPPQTPREMYDLFTEISKLVSALDTIHDCKITFDLDDGYDVAQIGYHRDLKPKNILKMGDIFMISDLGLAIFKEQGPVSNTEWILGESTYYAPECKANGKAGRLSDIWSLGCIFSEVVTFALRGATGIREFWKKRKQSYVDGISLDYFYKDDTVCKGVLEWFDELRLHAEHDPFIVEILGLIEEMLTPAQRRPRANAVDEKFSRILERERKRKGYEEPTPRAVFTDPRDPRDSRELRGPRKEFVISRDITETPEQIQGYLPPTPPEPLSLPLDQPVPVQPIVSPMLSNLIQGNQSQKSERKHTLMVNGPQIDGSDSGEERSSTPQGLRICDLDIQDSRKRDQPKTTGPPPLLYKVPGFVKKSLKGKNPFGYLKEFDTVFLIDNSESMNNHWDDVALALYRFIDLASYYDTDGVDLYFTDSEVSVTKAKTKKVYETFQSVKPIGSSPLTLRLETILLNYIAQFNTDRATKRLNLIVITNGDMTAIESPNDPIINCARKLDDIMAPARQVGVQFALIGSDEQAREVFGELDDELWRKHGVRDMVDTTPYDPYKDGRDDETLLKIMCGAVNRLLDHNNQS